MDILKKMFSRNMEEKSQTPKNEFRKPAWYEEDETDDELFGKSKAFQVFTNPIELQKHFERQMQEVLKSMKEMEENGEFFDQNLKDEYLKPGFENNFFEEFQKQTTDTDLDGEIYPDQLHSLMQRLAPELNNMLPKNNNKIKSNVIPAQDVKKKLTDEEKILGKIHGTIIDEDEKKPPAVRRKEGIAPKLSPHFGGVFEGTYQGPKMFGQSVITQTIRKPDGTYETKRVVKDSDGSVKTTITRTKEGKSETITSYDNGSDPNPVKKTPDSVLSSDRNIYVSKKGYALPMNLW